MVFRSNAMLVPAWTFLVLLTATFEVVSSVNGGWSDWTDWESCSVSCGQGSKRRYRFCNNPAPSSNGVWCDGKHINVASCSGPFECPVDGGWGQWSVWTPCSVSCGEGIMNRYRNCDSPAPANGGAACKEDPIETVKCFAKKECPRDGGWSVWSLWSPCSVTCGDNGQSFRHRACNNPPPTGDGKPCSGSSQQLNKCMASVKCGVNGQWSEWTVWSPCSVTCGSGVRNRWRRCDNPPPQNGGHDCNREDAGEMQERSCNGSIVFCPVDGGWSDWGDWGDCETSNCNNHKEFSYRYRERSCTNPHPAHKGSMCQGAFLNAGFCEGPVNCAVNGGWSEWTPWECTNFLGARSRTCNNPRPSNGGKPCRGDNLEKYTFDGDPKRFGELCPDFVGKAEVAGGKGDEVSRAGDDEDLKEGSASDSGENEMAEDDDV